MEKEEILVVDDQETIRGFLANLLTTSEWEVWSAASAEEAVPRPERLHLAPRHDGSRFFTLYHLLLETSEGNLPLAIRHLNGVYTGHFNRTHGRVGHLFQGRYKAIVVEKESYLLELSRYIHLNPFRVERKIKIDAYLWSSYLDYVGKTESSSLVDDRSRLESIR